MKLQEKPWSHDYRSKAFSHARFFGTVTMLPDSLRRPRFTPENQDEKIPNSLRCAGYAAAVNGRYIHGERMSPDWQVDKISRIQGKPVDFEGSDPNSAMSSQMYQNKGGYLPCMDWDAAKSMVLDTEAQNYGDKAYLKPDGGVDIFDSICNALYLAYDSNTGRGACVQAFSGWYDTFNASFVTSIGNLLGYHSYLFIDFEVVNGETVLVIQNSYGVGRWDGGFQRMTRPVVNDLFSRRGSSLKIPKTLTPEQIALAKQETPFGALQRAIINAWYQIVLLLM